jgi:hypothetical protein
MAMYLFYIFPALVWGWIGVLRLTCSYSFSRTRGTVHCDQRILSKKVLPPVCGYKQKPDKVKVCSSVVCNERCALTQVSVLRFPEPATDTMWRLTQAVYAIKSGSDRQSSKIHVTLNRVLYLINVCEPKAPGQLFIVFRLLKPSGFFTYHQAEHGACFAFSVLYGSQNRQRLFLYASLTDWFYNRGGKCLQRGTD